MRREFFFVFLVILLAGILRLWHLDTDLLFHRDQGMHAWGVWQIWHEHNFKLLGHSTDVDGINHGPLYYWIMTPAYAVAGGNPVAASAFQVLLEILSLPLLYIAVKRIFDTTTAKLTLLLYAISFGLIGYSRWLSNVTPILPFSHLLLFLLTEKRWLKNYGYYLAVGLVAGVIAQLNEAVGFALVPTIFWILKPDLSLKKVLLVLSGIFLPALPLVLFDFRHDFITVRAILRFATSGDGTGLTLSPLLGNISTYFVQVGHIISFPVIPLAVILWVSGFALTRNHPQRRLIWSWLLLPIGVLALVKRGAFGFFFVFNFGLTVALIGWAVVKSQSRIIWGLFLIALALNLISAFSLQKPTNGLIPIGSANLITISDRLKTVDWIYKMAGGAPFVVWIYTIPYYQDDAYSYTFAWYGQKTYRYQPLALGGFSPGEVKGAKHFFAIWEPDWDRPERLVGWLTEVKKNFGPPLSSYRSHDAAVSWHKLE